jgi:magnesium transporter
MELGIQNLHEQFEEVISRDNKLEMYEFMNSQNISDVANLINEYEDYSVQIITTLSTNRAASTFKILDFAIQKQIIQELPPLKTAELLNALPADDRTSFMEELPVEVVRELIKLLDPEERKDYPCTSWAIRKTALAD